MRRGESREQRKEEQSVRKPEELKQRGYNRRNGKKRMDNASEKETRLKGRVVLRKKKREQPRGEVGKKGRKNRETRTHEHT